MRSKRSGRTVAASAEQRPPGPHVIDPTAVYTIATATAALTLRKECLPREIRLGRLQARKRAGRYWILGKWLLAWLATGTPHRLWGEPARPLPLHTPADQADDDATRAG
jgi:hypothetical protein